MSKSIVIKSFISLEKPDLNCMFANNLSEKNLTSS
jgi:hypothetical protein